MMAAPLRRKALALALMGLLSACASAPGENGAPVTAAERARISERGVDLARTALAEERFADARKMIERVLMHEPDNQKAKLIYAESLAGLGEYEQALTRFEALMNAKDSLAARAYQGRGFVHLRQRDCTAASADFERAVQLDDTLWRSWNGLGICHDSEREWQAAADAYRAALEARPDAPAVLNNLGFSMLRQGEPGLAAKKFRKALSQDAGNELAAANLRLALAAQGAYEEAAKGVPGEAIPAVFNNIGYLALLRGDRTNAEAYLERAMEVDPAYNPVAARNLQRLKETKPSEKPQ